MMFLRFRPKGQKDAQGSISPLRVRIDGVGAPGVCFHVVFELVVQIPTQLQDNICARMCGRSDWEDVRQVALRVHFCRFCRPPENYTTSRQNYTTWRSSRRTNYTTRPEHYTTFGPQMSIEVYAFGLFFLPRCVMKCSALPNLPFFVHAEREELDETAQGCSRIVWRFRTSKRCARFEFPPSGSYKRSLSS